MIGYKLRAGETEWNELHVVDVMPWGEQADLRGRTYTSIYSPVNAKYPVTNSQPFATLRGEATAYSTSQEASRASVEQRDNTFRAELAVPVWTSQLFVSDWWNQQALPIQVRVTETDIEVENRLSTPLTGARLVGRGAVYELGQLPPGQTVHWARDGLKQTQLKTFLQSYHEVFKGAAGRRQQVFGGNSAQEITPTAESMIAASFLSDLQEEQNVQFVISPGLDVMGPVERGQMVLLAWSADASPLPPLNQFTARRSHRSTLWRVSVPAANRP